MCPVQEGAFSPLGTMQGARVRLSEDIHSVGWGAMVLPSWTRRTYRTPQSPRGRPFTGSGDLWRGSSQAGRGVFGFPEALRVC